MKIFDEIEYNGNIETIVFFIPMLNSKGQKQMTEESAYLAPSNKIVTVKNLKQKRKL